MSFDARSIAVICVGYGPIAISTIGILGTSEISQVYRRIVRNMRFNLITRMDVIFNYGN